MIWPYRRYITYLAETMAETEVDFEKPKKSWKHERSFKIPTWGRRWNCILWWSRRRWIWTIRFSNKSCGPLSTITTNNDFIVITLISLTQWSINSRSLFWFPLFHFVVSNNCSFPSPEFKMDEILCKTFNIQIEISYLNPITWPSSLCYFHRKKVTKESVSCQKNILIGADCEQTQRHRQKRCQFDLERSKIKTVQVEMYCYWCIMYIHY